MKQKQDKNEDQGKLADPWFALFVAETGAGDGYLFLSCFSSKYSDNNHMRNIRPQWVTAALVVFFVAPILVFATPEQEAQKAAEHWLSLVDSGKYEVSWSSASGYLKNAVTQNQFAQSLNAVRKPLGDVISRKLKSAKYATSLPGAPDGQYVVLQFDTTFTNKKAAVETVTPMLDKDDKWKVSGYYIK